MGLVQKAFSDIITFSRSSNATRIGPTGLVEYAPHNLILQSQTFDNASWSKTTGGTGVAPVVTANAAPAPDGTVTADLIVFDRGAGTSGSDISYLSQSVTSFSGAATASLWLKTSDGSTKVMSLRCGAPASERITVTGTWQRFSVVKQNATIDRMQILLYGNDGTQTVSVYAWGAQLAVGPYPLDYTPTTSAAVYGPRFDYDPVTLAARGLLIEEQRTNSILYSEQFDNAAWTKTRSSITANTVVAPDGTVTADKLVENTDTNSHLLLPLNAITLSTGIAYSYSIYAKAAERSILRLGNNDLGGVFFDVATGSVTSVGSGFTGSITSVGNGWYRLNAIQASNSNASGRLVVTLVSTGTTTSYTGDGVSGLYLWGAQLEAGAFATSYIPTVASSVTRSADVASVNTLSPWFNATEGTVFAEYDIAGYSSFNPVVDIGTDQNNIITMSLNSSIISRLVVVDGAVSQVNITLGVAIANTTYRQANAYKLNDFAATRNGGTVITDTSGTVPAVTQATLGGTIGLSRSLNGHLRRVAYYPRRLLDAELQTLTA